MKWLPDAHHLLVTTQLVLHINRCTVCLQHSANLHLTCHESLKRLPQSAWPSRQSADMQMQTHFVMICVGLAQAKKWLHSPPYKGARRSRKQQKPWRYLLSPARQLQPPTKICTTILFLAEPRLTFLVQFSLPSSCLQQEYSSFER